MGRRNNSMENKKWYFVIIETATEKEEICFKYDKEALKFAKEMKSFRNKIKIVETLYSTSEIIN
jgi:hypothetical protein